ncbi:MAG TPA: HAMP domain-containing sensor histidine kinase [Nitrospiria bacterium]|nr:HAMP domain-containing sensor histidine kinase [Nitrospiria bacterium]
MKFQRKLHLKIFTIFFTTSILIVLSIFYFARTLDVARKSSFLSVRKNLYVHLLSEIERMGAPPDPKISAEISKELDLKIGLYGNGLDWKSDPSVESYDRLKLMSNWHYKEMDFGRHEGHLFALTERAGFSYVFEFQSSEIFSFPYRLVAGLSIIVMVILMISFIVTRWLMNSVPPLVKGVEALSQGNLQYRIPILRRDEFGFLAHIFNNMAQQIQLMIKAKDKLLLDVSHELRSPMGRIKLAAEMIGQENLKTHIREDILEMEYMVDEILEGYRLTTPQGALKLEKINLGSFIMNLKDIYENSGSAVRFKNAVGNEAWIYGETFRLKKAITNLIDNGVKFSQAASDPVEVILSSDSTHYLIEIIDRGIGIKNSELNLIFEPFYKTDDSRNMASGGYGLGLSICKDIIEAHGGKISVSSREDNYTLFTVAIPKEAGI